MAVAMILASADWWLLLLQAVSAWDHTIMETGHVLQMVRLPKGQEGGREGMDREKERVECGSSAVHWSLIG